VKVVGYADVKFLAGRLPSFDRNRWINDLVSRRGHAVLFVNGWQLTGAARSLADYAKGLLKRGSTKWRLVIQFDEATRTSTRRFA
jgi:hypothetical protein